MKRLLLNVFRLILVVVGLLYAFWGVDFGLLLATFKRYDPLAVVLALGWGGLLFFALGYRLNRLAGGRVTLGRGVVGSVLCQGFNNMLPTKLGEVAKVIYLSHHSSLSRAEALGVVFWERFLDLNMLLLLGLLSVALLGRGELLWPMTLVLVTFWGGLLFFAHWQGLSLRLIGFFPFAHLRNFLVELHGHIQERLGLRFVALGGGYTLAVWLLSVAQAMLVFYLVAALPITLLQALTVFVVATLGLSIPSTPGGIGLFEAAVVWSLGWFGIAREEALGAAVMMRMVVFVPTVLVTLWLLFSRHELGLLRLFRGEEHGNEATSPPSQKGATDH